MIQVLSANRCNGLTDTKKDFAPETNSTLRPVQERCKFDFVDLQLDLQPNSATVSLIKAKKMISHTILEFLVDLSFQWSKRGIFVCFLD